MSTKKPVVVESYDEIVFTEPSEGFFARVQNHPAVIVPRLPPGFSLPPPGELLCFLYYLQVSQVLFLKLPNCISVSVVPTEDSDKRKRGDTKDNPLSQWFTNFSEADELLKLAAARQQVNMNSIIPISVILFSDHMKILTIICYSCNQTRAHTFILLSGFVICTC